MRRGPEKTALVLTGGGARAAYEVGVLKAIRELLPDARENPFPILCGTSAGAINAMAVAASAEDFGAGVQQLHDFWTNLKTRDVYRANPFSVAGSTVRWAAALASGWPLAESPRALLDNRPLRRLLETCVDLTGIETAIARHALHSVSVTCSGYASGQSVTFFQGRADLEPWRRAQRFGAHVKLTIDHLLASSAIPFVFPAVKLHREWFGDGAMRQLAPISPAIHQGAERVLVIGPGHMAAEGERPDGQTYPTRAQIAGHVLASIFVDSLTVDLARMIRINRTLALIPEETRRAQGLSLRPIEVLHITPSQRLDRLAADHVAALPWTVRRLLGNVGAAGPGGGALASYLLFEPPYTQALIALGYADTMNRREDVTAFLTRPAHSPSLEVNVSVP